MQAAEEPPARAVAAEQTEAFFDRHLASAVLVILRGAGMHRTVELCLRAWDAGVELVEIPVQSKEDLASLIAALGVAGDRPIGAGTIVSHELLDQVAQAGAAFTVAPGWDPEIAADSLERGLPHLPGVATASEIHAAGRAGLRWLKMFPATSLGATWVRAMLAPFPDVRLVATGGITVANAWEFLGAGCRAVALGSSFAAAPLSAVHELTTAMRHDS
jgi:Entner-Doudoroff aldolase